MIRDEGALLRVDRDQRHRRRRVVAEGLRVALGVALVVVPDRLLLDRHRRDVREALAAVVGALQVREERQRDVAVVHDRGLHPAHEVLHLGLLDPGDREVTREPGRREVRSDERMQPRGREVRVGLPELERAPFGMPVRPPPRGILGEVEQGLPTDLGFGPAERLGHRLRHRDRRAGSRRCSRTRRARGSGDRCSPSAAGAAPPMTTQPATTRLAADHRPVRPSLATARPSSPPRTSR